jgi:acetoin utilization deacetylase AcuC-like enzyme
MPQPLYVHHRSSLEHETGAHPENPRRIPAIEGELERRGWLGYQRVEAPGVNGEVLGAVHSDGYVELVRAMSDRGGGAFDLDTVASAGSYQAALHSAGGACLLVEQLLSGEAPTGFCGLRPPGHHADVARAMGFCLFNNVAVATRYAIDRLGARRVLILDWDVHHGNGTNDIFHERFDVLYASIHESPLYPGTGPASDVGSGPGEGYTVNLPVPSGSGEDVWLSLVEHVVAPLGRLFEPDLVLISAGFDAHANDPLATCRLRTESFGAMAARMGRLGEELDVPVGAVLEGGYDLEALAGSVAATMDALANGASPPAVDRHPLAEAARGRLATWWDLG